MTRIASKKQNPLLPGKGWRAWLALAVGLGLIWALAYVVLPLGQALPHIQPIMESIDRANIDVGSYWYTQSEETAQAQLFIRNAIRKQN